VQSIKIEANGKTQAFKSTYSVGCTELLKFSTVYGENSKVQTG